MNKNVSVNHSYKNLIKVIALITIGYSIFIVLFNSVDNFNDSLIQIIIKCMNWVGIFILCYAYISWKKKTNTIFSPYMILFTFFFLFNYGQCFMWAFGIHIKTEIGMMSKVGILDPKIILKTQLITSICMLFFHIGALSCYRFKYNLEKTSSREITSFAFRVIGIPTAIVSIPATIYKSWQSFRFSQVYGYTALYYGDVVQGGIFLYLDFLFFPSLICLLIGYNFSKKSITFVNTIFAIYMIINLISGDRGSWIYRLLILMWCNIIAKDYSAKDIKKKILKYVIFLMLCIPVVTIIVSFREVGLTSIFESDISTLFTKFTDPYIKPIFEMGQSMRVLGILIRDDLHNFWPYGSTYIPAILGMTLPRFKVLFGYPDMYLDNWFSQDYLNLKNYGEGFSMVGEAYLNYGEYLAPFAILIFGFLLGTLLYYNNDSSKNNTKSLIGIFITTTSCSTFAGYARGSLTYFARMWFWGTVAIYIFVVMFINLASSRHKA